jgi:DNA-binding CsgD family transcriptional regulator
MESIRIDNLTRVPAEARSRRPFLGDLVRTSRAALVAPPLIAPSVAVADSARRDSFGLTAREREVLGLVAEGFSDQAIGDQLRISKRTASSHVGTIKEKLGVSNRTAAATLAVRRGLV